MKRINLITYRKAADLIFLCSLFLGISSSSLVFMMGSSVRADEPVSTERDQYRQLDLQSLEDPTLLTGKSPMAIALSIFGFQELGEGNFQQKIKIKRLGDNQRRIYLIQQNVPDDSVRNLRYLLEFDRQNDQWQLVWAGRQQICWPGRGSQEYSKEICS